MNTTYTSPDASATPSKESRTRPGRDRRKATHHDGSASTDEKAANDPPVPEVPTHGLGRLLWELPPDTSWEEVARRWQAKNATEQTSVTEWCE